MEKNFDDLGKQENSNSDKELYKMTSEDIKNFHQLLDFMRIKLMNIINNDSEFAFLPLEQRFKFADFCEKALAEAMFFYYKRHGTLRFNMRSYVFQASGQKIKKTEYIKQMTENTENDVCKYTGKDSLDGFCIPKDVSPRDFTPGGRFGDNIRDWRNE